MKRAQRIIRFKKRVKHAGDEKPQRSSIHSSYATVYDVIVIGGGVSGLQVAIDVKSNNPNWNVCVIEREPICGGRISTEYGDGENVLFERGPWRVHSSHYKLRNLIDKYKLKTSICTSSLHQGTLKTHVGISGSAFFESPMASGEDVPNCETSSSVSTWDADAFHTSTLQADENGRLTGYGPDFRSGAGGTNTYRVKNKEEESQFLFVTEGFQELINRMQRHSKDLGVHIYTHHGVTDVHFDTNVYRYKVHANYRFNSDHKFEKCTFIGKRMCLALPPHCITKWTISKHLHLQSSQVSSLPLMHVYASLNRIKLLHHLEQAFEKVDIKGFHIIHDGITQQFISSNYDAQANWTQVAYVGGRYARSLERIRRCDGMRGLKTVIVKDLTKVFQKGSHERTIKPEINLNEMIDVDEIKPCYYANAVHKWEAAFGLTPRLASWLATAAPHPLHLPNLVTAGEAWSLKQGWIEGALETAETAVSELCNSVALIDRLEEMRTFPKQTMVYDGWILDVSKWHEFHPGSSVAILKYASQSVRDDPPADVQELFNHINHSQDATRVLAALRVGIIGRNQKYLQLKEPPDSKNVE